MSTDTAIKTKLFELGRTVITPAALEALKESRQTPHEFLQRHQTGDWGEELDEGDRKENDFSLKNGYRLLSAYKTSKGQRLWIITEHDRSYTTVMLPSDY
jgi:hypothetical protein